MSNKLLLGLLLTILLFVTVVLVTARTYVKEGKFKQEHTSPTAPPAVPAPTAPPVAE